MSLRKNVDEGDIISLMIMQLVISVILTGVNAGIVGWELMGSAFISQPEVIMWYYASASFLVLVFYWVLAWIYVEIFQCNESGGSA